MKHLTEYLSENIYRSSLLDFYFKDMKTGILDIETTGLNPSRNKFILGGLYDCDNNTIHQIFAENRKEEANALHEFYQIISGMDMVVTYNGKHFDLPFLKKRREQLFQTDVAMPYNLDLYLVLNGHSPIKKFVPNLKQKTVENYMGLWEHRTDEISGAESVELYNEYERTGKPSLAEKILLHNSDDVIQLTRLLKIVSKSDFHKAMYHLGFPASTLIINKIDIRKNTMTVTGIQRKKPLNYIGFYFRDYPVETNFNMKDASFTFKFPVLRESGMGILDLQAAYMDSNEFEIYPSYSSGFLVIENRTQKNHMEINHFVKRFIEMFLNNI